MTKPLTILGIESSCDDTAAAVLRWSPETGVEVLSNVVHTQLEDHANYGGVVPELAARAHVVKADKIVAEAMKQSGLSGYNDLDGVAATSGPGLIGGVMVGMTTGKAIATGADIPFIPVNHLEGHALSPRLTEDIPFPYLLLLVSGGHTQLLLVKAYGEYQRLGTTIDDAAGEAFDKTAKLLDLGQPGGPKVEAAAKSGDANKFKLPRPLHGRQDCDFSFSGLKTAVRTLAEENAPLSKQDTNDLAASFQYAAARHLLVKTEWAMEHHKTGRLVVAGGVAANSLIRDGLFDLAQKHDWNLVVPPAKYCTDNGAMIALAGLEYIRAKGFPDQTDALSFVPKARWPLDDNPTGRPHGGGKKGPKA